MSKNVSNPNSFKSVQKIFTQHLRDPEKNIPPEGLEDCRLQIYRELIYNKFQNFLGNCFPVFRKIMDDESWHKLMRDYVSQHQARTPLFPKMPQEFLKYLNDDNSRIPKAFPFLEELAHYEWVETSLSFDEREADFEHIDSSADLMSGIPVLNPVSMPLAYRWPVHKLSPDFIPDTPPADMTYIIVFRKENFEISFIELNPVSARLIEHINAQLDKTTHELLMNIAEELQHPNPEIVVNGGAILINNMFDAGVILGVKKDV